MALAIDVGGTKIAAGLVDRNGKVHCLQTVPTGSPGAESLQRAARVAAELAARSGDFGVLGTGIGIPELVENGCITSQAVVAWTDAGVKEAFGDFGPIRVEADIRAAALAEARVGSGAASSVSVYVNLGTGISHCLLIEGRPFGGRHGRALLSGSTRLMVLDSARNRLVGGCVEDVASGRGISERYQSLTGEAVAASRVFRRAGKGDKVARLVVDQAVELLGHMVANLIDLLDPGRVIVGGGLCRVAGLLEQIAKVARRTVWADGARQIPIAPAIAGPEAGVIGAGLALFDRLNRGRTASNTLY